MTSQVTYPDKFDPHGKDKCQYCHSDANNPNKTNILVNSCEDCHNPESVKNLIKHPVSVIISPADSTEIPTDFPLFENKLHCITCHKPLCKTHFYNKDFLRNGNFIDDLEFCYNCHKPELYEQTNPHIQLVNEKDEIDRSKCLHCHVSSPDINLPEDGDKKLILDVKCTCNKCHSLHTHENEHMGRDFFNYDAADFESFNEVKEKYQLDMPLAGGHIIQCNTCHYSHERILGIQNEAIYSGAGDNQYYLRLDNAIICLVCHKKHLETPTKR